MENNKFDKALNRLDKIAQIVRQFGITIALAGPMILEMLDRLK